MLEGMGRGSYVLLVSLYPFRTESSLPCWQLSLVTFNPTAEGIVASTAFDMTVRTWSVMEAAEAYIVSRTRSRHV